LRDGTVITIRPIRPDDAPRLQAFFARLSPESIYSRFLGFRSELPREQAEFLANVDCQTQMALVATRKQFDKEDVIADARYFVIPAEEPGLAEAAIVVEDRYQNRGLGTLLLKRLAANARMRGIHTFLAAVHHSNSWIIRRIRRNGLPTESRVDEGTREIRVKLEIEPDHRNMVDG
jgi:GNAT superfamily N-acetyltransferase